MAQIQTTIHSVLDETQARELFKRISGIAERCLLRDFRALFQPDQAAAPLVIAAVLGTVLSFIPAPFLDTFLVGIIFTRFRQINRSALLAARFVWNDFVVVPLYMPGFRFGMRLLDPLVVDDAAIAVRIVAFLIGLIPLVLAAAVISAAAMLVIIGILGRQKGQPPSMGVKTSQGSAYGAAIPAGDFQR